ncbi:MAG: site-specific integrase [Candidatus Dormibacteria bacterium]
MKRALAVVTGDLPMLRSAFLLGMEAEGESPRTIASYGYSVAPFLEYADAHAWPGWGEEITRQHMTAWLAHLQRETRGSTPAAKYRGAARLFSRLVAEGEIEVSPMVGMRPTAIPEELPEFPTDERCEHRATEPGQPPRSGGPGTSQGSVEW